MKYPLLDELAEHPSPRVRVRAALSFWKQGDPSSLAVLRKLLYDPVEMVRRAAVRSAKKLKNEAVGLLIEILHQGDSLVVMREVVSAVAASGNPAAMQELVTLYATFPGEVQAVLIRELYRTGWRDPGLLLSALNDSNHLVRSSAASAASSFGGARVVVPLRDCAYDGCPDVRAAALESLAMQGDGDSLELFMVATRDSHPAVRVAACKSLSRTLDDSAVGALASCLEDDRPEVRCAAAHALGALASDECCQYLRKALIDPDSRVRDASMQALERNGFRTPEGLVALGDRIKQSGDEEKAVDLWRQAVDEGPFCETAYLRLGEYWLRKDEAAEARSCFYRVCEINPESREGCLGLARSEVKAGNYRSAERFLAGVLKRNRDDFEAHRLLGEIMLASGRLSRSLDHFRTIRGTGFDDPRVLAGLGKVYLKKKDWRRAMVYLRKALEIDEFIPVWRELGDALERLGEQDRAVECFWKALCLNPDDRPALLRLQRAFPSGDEEGRVERALTASLARTGDSVVVFVLAKLRERSGRLAEAKDVLAEKVQEGDAPPFIHYNLGRICYLQNDVPGAVRHLEATVSIDEKLVPARRLLARALVQQGKRNEAVSLLEPLVREHSKDRNLLEETAALAEKTGRLELAIWCLERIVASASQCTDSRKKLAHLLTTGNRLEEAVLHLETALIENPSDRRTRLDMVECLDNLGRYSEAIEIMSLMDDYPDDRRWALLMSGLLEHEGKLQESEAVLARTAGVRPDDGEILGRRGHLLLVRQQWEKAIEVFSRLLEIASDTYQGHFGLATAFKALGKSRQALQHYLRAAHISPDDPDAWLEAAELSSEQGDYSGAHHYFSRAFALGMESDRLLAGLGEVREFQGKEEEATALYRKALNSNPKQVKGHLGLARILANREEYQPAVDMLLEGLKQAEGASERGVLAREAGRLLAGLGRRNEAVFYIREAVSRNEKDGFAQYELGRLFLEDELYSEADRHLKAACSLLPGEVRPRLALAELRFIQGQLNESAVLYQEAYDLCPENTALLLRLGVVYKALGMFRKAAEFLDRALVARPDDPEVHLERGYLFLARSRLPEAREALEKTLSLDGSLLEARFRLGEILAEIGDRKQAIETLNSLVDEVPGHVAAHRILGIICEEACDFDQASVHFRQVLLLKKEDLVSSLSLGRITFLKGNYREAMVHLERAADQCPTSPEVLMWLGRVHLVSGEYGEAVQLLEKAVQLGEDSVPGRFWFGKALYLTGEIDAAKPLFEQLLECPAYKYEAHLALGRILVHEGRDEEAGEHLQQVLAKRPRDPEALFELGRMALELGDLERAEMLLTRAREAGCYEPALLELLATVLDKTGRLEEARQLCLEGIKGNFNRKSLLEKLAIIEEKSGYPARALIFYSRLLDMDSSNGSLMLRIGRLLARLSRTEECLVILRRAAAMVPEEPELWRLFSEVYRVMGNTDGLEESLQRLVKVAAGDVSAREELAIILLGKNNVDTAIELLNDGLSWDRDGRLWRLLAQSHERNQDFRQAVRAWIRVYRLSLESPWALLNLAEALHFLGRNRRAHHLAESVARREPDNGRCCYLVGKTLVAQNLRSAAAPWFRRAASLGFEKGTCYLELGRCFLAEKAYPEAHGVLSRVVELRSDDTEARYLLAIASSRVGRTEESLAHLDALDKMYSNNMSPNSWRSLLLRAKILWGNGAVANAGRYFVKASRMAPREPEALIQTAEYLLETGYWEESLKFYRRASGLMGDAQKDDERVRIGRASGLMGDAQKDDERVRIGRARAATAAGHLSEALAVLEGLSGSGLLESEILYRRGLAKYLTGNLNTAVEDLETAVRATSGIQTPSAGSDVRERSVRLLARIFEQSGKWTEALPLREDLAATGSAAPFDLLIMGDDAFKAGYLTRAGTYYARYIDVRDEDLAVTVRLARLRRGERSYDRAIILYRKAFATSPYDTSIARELACTLREAHRLEEARTLLETLAERYPGELETRIELGKICLEMHDQSAALLNFRRAALNEQAPADIFKFIGQASLDHGDLDGAETAYRKLLALIPDDAATTYSLAQVLLKQEQPVRAFRLLKNYLSHHPAEVECRIQMAAICRQKGHTWMAERLLRTVLDVSPDNPDVHLQLGRISFEKGDQHAALDHLQRACSLRPGHIPALRLIGQIYREIGLIDAALDTYRKLIASSPEEAGILFDYASLLAESGRSDESIAVYQRLTRAEPDNPEALYNLGLVYNSEGHLEKAVECYRKVVKIAIPGSPVHRLASEMIKPRRVSIEVNE